MVLMWARASFSRTIICILFSVFGLGSASEQPNAEACRESTETLSAFDRSSEPMKGHSFIQALAGQHPTFQSRKQPTVHEVVKVKSDSDTADRGTLEVISKSPGQNDAQVTKNVKDSSMKTNEGKETSTFTSVSQLFDGGDRTMKYDVA
eukprot:TRINITY_DN64456_c0_g1_i1.p1 TRINITY_DN64456_c0_g1~~TRINITY_DN64456_c0_g1_i1.p1  ORF type:complete len:149 (+),score=19.38 TRINITY_DN64456_c0_g1_i1:129-575(+)